MIHKIDYTNATKEFNIIHSIIFVLKCHRNHMFFYNGVHIVIGVHVIIDSTTFWIKIIN